VVSVVARVVDAFATASRANSANVHGPFASVASAAAAVGEIV
jgi:hypothetical protein